MILSPVHAEEDLARTWLGNVLILQADVPRLVEDCCQVVRGCGVGRHLDFLSFGRVAVMKHYRLLRKPHTECALDCFPKTSQSCFEGDGL